MDFQNTSCHASMRVIKEVQALNEKIILHVNPTGKFVIGGPHGDTGLTGREDHRR